MAGERRARVARRGLQRGKEPPGLAGKSNKTNASTCMLQLFVKFHVLNLEGSDREIRYFGFAPSATNRHGRALNCPSGSRSVRTYGLPCGEDRYCPTWASPTNGLARIRGGTRLPIGGCIRAGIRANQAPPVPVDTYHSSQPGRLPVPVDTYRLRLTPVDGVERQGPTRPGVLADPT